MRYCFFLLVAGLLFLVGCSESSEDHQAKPTDQTGGGQPAIDQAEQEAAANSPGVRWSQSEFNQLPEVIIADNAVAPKPFSGEEQPEDTPVPQEILGILNSYDEKDFDALAKAATTFPQKKVRKEALGQLQHMDQGREAELIQILRAGMKDKDPDVRAKAVSVLIYRAKYWDPKLTVVGLPELAALLGNTEAPFTAGSAAHVIGLIGPDAAPALPQLCWAATHLDDTNADAALETIAKIAPHPDEVIPLVYQILLKQKRNAAAEALGQLQATNLVMKLLQSDDQKLKELGVSASVYLEEYPPEMVTALLAGVTNGSPLMRSYAVEALGNVRPSTPEIAATIKSASQDDKPYVRYAVYKAIAALNPPDPETLEFLSKCLDNTTDQSQKEAIQEAIVAWKDNNKVPVESYLEEIVESGGDVPNAMLERADEFYDPLIKIVADKNQPNEARAAALYSLIYVRSYVSEGQNEKVDQIVSTTRDVLAEKPDQPLFGSATAIVDNLDRNAEDAQQLRIAGISKGAFSKIRAQGIMDIGYSKINEGLAMLIKMLDEQDPELTTQLLDAIGKFGDTAADAVPKIVKISVKPGVREQSRLFEAQMKALAGIGAHPELSVPYLENLYNSTEPSVRERAEILPALATILVKNDEDPAFVIKQLDTDLDSPNPSLSDFFAVSVLGPKAASLVPKVIPFIDSDVFRHYAIVAINDIGPGAKAAVPALIKSFDQGKDQHLAILALGAIHASGPEFDELVNKAMMDDKLRPTMLRSLARMGPDAAKYIPQIANALESSEADQRKYAAEALGNIGPAAKPHLETLKKLSEEDPHYSVKPAAKKAVEQIESSSL